MSEKSSVLSNEHRIALSYVITNWALAERVVADSLWEVATGHSFSELTAEKSLSLSFIAGMDSRTALGLLQSSFRARYPNDADEFDKIAKKLSTFSKTRNIIAHGRWQKGKRPNTIETKYFSAMGTLKVETHAYTAAEMMATATRMMETLQVFVRFLQGRGFWKSPPAHLPKAEAKAKD